MLPLLRAAAAAALALLPLLPLLLLFELPFFDPTLPERLLCVLPLAEGGVEAAVVLGTASGSLFDSPGRWPDKSILTLLERSSILKLYGMEMKPDSHTCT